MLFLCDLLSHLIEMPLFVVAVGQSLKFPPHAILKHLVLSSLSSFVCSKPQHKIAFCINPACLPWTVPQCISDMAKSTSLPKSHEVCLS